MGTAVIDVINAVYTDGPSSSPDQPDKVLIRTQVGPVIQAEIDAANERIDEAEALIVTGAKRKDAVRVATTTNGTLASAFENGDTVDGVVLATGNRILLKDQSTASQNGIYVVAASGAPTRATDADADGELPGATVFVTDGTANKATTWTCNNTAVTLGVTDIVFVKTAAQDTSVPTGLDALRARANAIAAASTINLTTATGDYVPVTGSTGIGTVTLADGKERVVIFTDSPLITVGASLIGDNNGLPVQIQPGDMAIFKGEASSVVRFRTFRAIPPVQDDPDGDEIAWAVVDSTGRVVISVHHDGSIYTTGASITPDILPNYDPDILPYFVADLCGIEGEEVTLYAENLLADRSDGSRVRVLAHGEDRSAYQRQAREELVIRPDLMIDYPASATGTGIIGIRAAYDKWLTYGEMPINIRVAEKTPTTFTLNILNFGDSTLNLGFMSWTKYWMAKFGYPVPLGIGTIAGVADAGDVDSATTRLGEPKPGHWFADFTYRNTDRIDPLPIGDEATYAAMTTEDKRLFNTMLRDDALAAVDGGAVNPADIRNGYYMDFQFYVARHSLATPTMLVFNPLTNDLTHLAEEDVYDFVYEDMVTVARRWKAAYPSAPIVYFLPPTGDSDDRVVLWRTNYEQGRRAIAKAETDIRALGIDFTVVATYAMVSTSADFDTIAYDETPDADLGSVVRAIDDGVHVTGAGRASMFKHVAYAICCAATGV